MKAADARAVRKSIGCIKRCGAAGKYTHHRDCPNVGMWIENGVVSADLSAKVVPFRALRSRVDPDLREAVTPLIEALRADGGDRILVVGTRTFTSEVQIGGMAGTQTSRESWTGNMIANAIETLLDGAP